MNTSRPGARCRSFSSARSGAIRIEKAVMKAGSRPKGRLRISRGYRGPAVAVGLAACLGADDVAEQIPFAALELHHLELFDRGEIGGRSIDLDAGDQGIRRKILQAGGLLHD